MRALSWLLTFAYVTLAWVFFRSTSVENACLLLSHIAEDFSWDYLVPFVKARTAWSVFAVVGFALHALRGHHADSLKKTFVRAPWIVKLILTIIVIQFAINVSSQGVAPFIYAQF